ncbi:MAG: hypothetical protein L0206_17960, partial [Actinobacteria bacterium]|nr:hypothetical protein [Actinomycetota bacterium]
MILKTGDPLGTSGAVYGGFASANLNANLESAFTDKAHGVYFGATPLLTDAAPPPPPFTLGSTYKYFADSKINDARLVLASLTVNDPATAAITDDAMMLLQADAAGTLSTYTVLAMEGLLIPGLPGPVYDVADDRRRFDLNAAGDALFYVEADVGAILLNTSVLVKSGDQSPVFGSTYSISDSSVALGDGGHYAFIGAYEGGLALVFGGAEVAQVGKPMPGLPQFELESFGGRFLDIDENGRLLWFADWSDPDETRDTAIVRDHELLVQEGVSLAGGQVVDVLIGDFGISSNGRYLVYTAKFVDGSSGAFVLDLAGGVTPFSGCAPNPALLETPVGVEPGGIFSVNLKQPQSDLASGFLAVATSYATSPGACGILVPGIGEVLIGAPFAT